MTHIPSGTGPALPLNAVAGRAPGGTPAFSNADVENFGGVQNHYNEFFTGYQWQCVEFARRWLWDRKGLLLPDINIAAQLFFIPHVFNDKMEPAPVKMCASGKSLTPPTPDSLIIHAAHWENFPGHVGVIVDVCLKEKRIRVADQNRLFHQWPDGKAYSLELPISQDAATGAWTIHDKEEPVLGWIEFPGQPNVAVPATPVAVPPNVGREAPAPLTHPLPKTVTGTPVLPSKVNRGTFWKALWHFKPGAYYVPVVLTRIIFMLVWYKLIFYPGRRLIRRLRGLDPHTGSPHSPSKHKDKKDF